jgi:hypothetical protein
MAGRVLFLRYPPSSILAPARDSAGPLRYPLSSILHPRWRNFHPRPRRSAAFPAYVLGGNTPCNAMQKLSVRYGCMLLCGKLLPLGEMA